MAEARNASELHYFLDQAKPRDTIQLCENVYEGSFKLKVDKITLLGAGPDKSILKCDQTPLEICSSSNNLSGFRIECKTTSEEKFAVIVSGRKNKSDDIIVCAGQFTVMVNEIDWTEKLPSLTHNGDLACNFENFVQHAKSVLGSRKDVRERITIYPLGQRSFFSE